MNKKTPKRYLFVHTHKFGVSHAFFTAVGFNPMKVTDEKKIKIMATACGLDFEPEGEELTLFVADKDSAVITKADLEAPRDKKGKLLHLGQTVVVPEPSLPDDSWKHSFQGTVRSIKAIFNGLVCVVDQEDNGWDVEPDRLEII